MADDIFLSVIIPAFNEETRIVKSLETICHFLREQYYSFEILVIDDGSSDRTSGLAKSVLNGANYEVIRVDQNQGKGNAVRTGMLKARGKYRLFSDADLSTPIEEVTPMIGLLEKDFDLVIGSRALKDSNVEIHQSWLRQTMGKVFNLFARLLVFHQVRDSQCGFKCFRAEAANDLFFRQKIKGFSFDAEIIFLAQKCGYQIKEVPVTWRHSPTSRVHMIRSPLEMFWDLLKIRWIHRNEKFR